MKKSFRILTLVFAVIMISGLLTACADAERNRERIVGTWYVLEDGEEAGATYTFSQDGVITMGIYVPGEAQPQYELDASFSLSYEIKDANTMIIGGTAFGIEGQDGEECYEFIDDNTLRIGDSTYYRYNY